MQTALPHLPPYSVSTIAIPAPFALLVCLSVSVRLSVCLSLQIHVGMPDASARRSILDVLLRGERVGADLQPTHIDGLAAATEGYSGSDLKELVRAASMGPIREALSKGPRPGMSAASSSAVADGSSGSGGAAGGAGSGSGATTAAGSRPPLAARGISAEDFAAALREVKPSGSQARSYYVEALRSGQGWGDHSDDGSGGGAAASGAGARGRRAAAGAAGGSARLNVGPAAAAAASATSGVGAAAAGASDSSCSGSGSGSGAGSTGGPLDGPTMAVLMAGHSMRANTDALTAAVEEKARQQQSPVKSSPAASPPTSSPAGAASAAGTGL